MVGSYGQNGYARQSFKEGFSSYRISSPYEYRIIIKVTEVDVIANRVKREFLPPSI